MDASAMADDSVASEAVPGIVHGAGGYTNHYCRCDVCREGNRNNKARARAAHRARRLAHIGPGPYIPTENITHGAAGYNHFQCRCPVCVQANRDQSAKTRVARKGTKNG